jgi:hypothetical protein
MTFMAVLTLMLVVSVQAASFYGLLTGKLDLQGYLAVWVPLMTMAAGFWFGKQQAG